MRVTLRVAPLDGTGGGAEIGFRALRVDAVGFAGIADIGEDVAGMVQDDVENDVEAEIVGGVNQGAKFVVGIVGIAGEAGIDVEKIVNAIAVIRAALKRNILENRTQPDGACAELLDIGKLILNAGQIAALKIDSSSGRQRADGAAARGNC